jgi:hypothetical protein
MNTTTINGKTYVIIAQRSTADMRAETPRAAENHEANGVFGIAYVRLPKGRIGKTAYVSKDGSFHF